MIKFSDSVFLWTHCVICDVNYYGRYCVSNYLHCLIRPESLLYVVEHDLLAMATFLVNKLITHNNIDVVSVAECTIDLNFVVDSSGSISDDNWQKSLKFVSDIVRRLPIGPTRVRVAFVVFSTTANVEWGLLRYQDEASLLAAIQNVQKRGLRTNLNEALYLTWSQVFTQARPNVNKITIILTDGEDNEPEIGTQLTINNATRCKTDGIRLVAVGVDFVNEVRLRDQIASLHDFHKVDDFDALDTVIDKLLTEDNCIAPPGTDRN